MLVENIGAYCFVLMLGVLLIKKKSVDARGSIYLGIESLCMRLENVLFFGIHKSQ